MPYDLNKVIKSITADKIYTVTDIVKGEMLPDVKTYPSVLGRVREDLMLPKKDQLLKVLKVGTGDATRYLITGKNLIKYLKLYAQRTTLYHGRKGNRDSKK